MAIQDQTQGGLGIRRLTPEEQARIAAQQAQYQQQLAARQAVERQQFDQTQAVGLANQAMTPGAPAVVPPAAATPAVVPPAAQRVDVPATTSVVPPAPAPTPARGLTNQEVLAQDRSNLQALVESQPNFTGPAQGRGATPATTLSPDVLADANQRIAQTLADSRTIGPQPGAERGDFNVATTSRVGPGGQISTTLRQPENIIEGGYGGFGAGGNQGVSAREYLTRVEAQDAVQRAQRGERRREIAADVERIGLQRAATSGSVAEAATARRALASLDARELTLAERRLQEGGATQRTQLQTEAEMARAGLSGAAAVQAAVAGAAGRQQAAETAADATVRAAGLRAAGATQAAQTTATSPQAQLAAQRARLIEEQLVLAGQAQQAGDVAGTQAALGINQAQPQVIRDNISGVPVGYIDAQGNPVLYTPAQQARIRAAFNPQQE